MKTKGDVHIAAAFLFIVIGLGLFTSEFHKSDFNTKELREKAGVFKPVIDSLIDMGIDSVFIYSLVADQRTAFDEKYVKINVTGYLKKADYSSNYNWSSVKKCRKFFNENRTLLNDVESIYGVPSEVLTSILFIETKLGNYTGNHHIVSVYLSTALANKYEFIQMNLNELKNNANIDSIAMDTLREKVYSRAEKKSLWAKEQLLYLDSARSKLPYSVLKLKGSWAGAFGLSQFIPSSYVSWAVDGNGDGKINLFDLEDAVYSIGNYLRSNGWSNNESDKRRAVHHYNNSDDYVNAVLKLASRI